MTPSSKCKDGDTQETNRCIWEAGKAEQETRDLAPLQKNSWKQGHCKNKEF